MRQDLPAKDGTLDEPADVAEVELTVEPPSGEVVAVKLQTLVERIYVAPGAPGWLRDLVESVTRRYGLDVEVHQSSLDADPVY